MDDIYGLQERTLRTQRITAYILFATSAIVIAQAIFNLMVTRKVANERRQMAEQIEYIEKWRQSQYLLP
jgi:hypothetical protein